MNQFNTDAIDFRLVEDHLNHKHEEKIKRFDIKTVEKEQRLELIDNIFEQLSEKTYIIENELIKNGSYTHSLEKPLYLEDIHELIEHPKYKKFYHHWLSLAVVPLFDVYDKYRTDEITNNDPSDEFYQNPYEYGITSIKIHFILDANLEYINKDTNQKDKTDDLYLYISGYPFKLPEKLQKFFTHKDERRF